MKDTRPYKRWSAEEIAWLTFNLEKGNIYLEKVLGRTIPSIESMKRNIRSEKQDVDPELFGAVVYSDPDFKHWMGNPDVYLAYYIQHISGEDNLTEFDRYILNKYYPSRVIHDSVPNVPKVDQTEEPTCIGDRQKELGINNSRGLTGWQQLAIASGVLFLLMYLLMLIANR